MSWTACRAYTANARYGQPLTIEERDEFIRALARQSKTTNEIAKITSLSQWEGQNLCKAK